MFTDEPSPFRPDQDSLWPWAAAITVTVAAATGLGFYVARVDEHNRLPDQPLAGHRQISQAVPAPQPTHAMHDQFDTFVPSQPSNAEPRDLTATIYLCKGYAGGTFWSNAVCSSQRATIDRMTTVPADLSFDQQVAIASGQATEAAQFYNAQAGGGPASVGAPATSPAVSRECAALIELTKDLDASALRLQSAATQDQIRRQRMDIMSERALHHC